MIQRKMRVAAIERMSMMIRMIMMIMTMIWWMTIETCLFPIRSSTVGPGLAGAYEMSNHQMVSITNPHRSDLRTSQS